MVFAFILAVLLAIAVVAFVDIQLYMFRLQKDKDLDAWFERFEKFNRECYRDPELSWRYYILDKSFHKPSKP